MDVEINLPRAAHSGSVKIDGKVVEGVTRVVVLADVSGITKVRLSLIPENVRVRATDPDLTSRHVERD